MTQFKKIMSSSNNIISSINLACSKCRVSFIISNILVVAVEK